MKSIEKLLTQIKGLFRENRGRLSDTFSKKNRKGLILLESNINIHRNADTTYPFRQDSSFYWATGCDMEESCLLIDYELGKDILFYKSPSSKDGIWHGRVLTSEELCLQYDIDHAKDIVELKLYVEDRIGDQGTLFRFPTMRDFVDLSEFNTDTTVLKEEIESLRNIKTEKELMIMQYSSDVSSNAFIEVMKNTKPSGTEYQLESIFKYHCGINGAVEMAYTPIVGTGYNGACLHYTKNNDTIRDGDLVLMDAGSEVLCYATDITRTFPANGKFTEQQKLIYNIVLKAHYHGIELVKPGAVWSTILQSCFDNLTDSMIDAGFIIGKDVEEIKKLLVIKVFMPHGLGHYVGLDVHDTVIIPKKPLEKGNVVTIEPGIYFNASALEDARNNPNMSKYINWEKVDLYKDFGGIRIEDSVLVTENGSLSLTKVPKEIDDIEKLMENKNI